VEDHAGNGYRTRHPTAVDDGLLSPEAPGGDQSFVVDPVVFAPENRLPALVTDPRRPKQ
jgi:hypothetical protein